MIIVIFAEAMLIIRVYALTGKSKTALTILLCIWTCQIGLMCFTIRFAGGMAVRSSQNHFRCLLTDFKYFVYVFILPTVVFDTAAFMLTLYALFDSLRRGLEATVSKLILRDGLLYFLGLFSVNVAWAISSRLLGEEGLKNSLGL
ncbi:hypothetical protein HGRIS_010602 [Hohenbuehelia grisea]|uniref:Uncharacterized protein n=1 Tax=Hohenbuehelia grisea TaxID=104357 RepID=A0ABR3IXF1_9AGAR